MPRACTVRGRAHARKLPGETSRQIARKRPTRAKRRGDRLRRSSVRQLDVFFAERFVDFRADDFVERFVDFRADDFVARFVDVRAEDFVARFVDFRADFFAVLRPVFFADFFADFFGTLPPARRASDSPIAIACLRLFTFLPDLPLRNVPALRSCIAFSTLDCAFLPYFAIVSSCRNGADRFVRVTAPSRFDCSVHAMVPPGTSRPTNARHRASVASSSCLRSSRFRILP